MSPFKSKAQQGYLHSHPEILGEKIHEWDAATKGKTLPEHKGSSLAAHGLAHHSPTSPIKKHLKEMHIKELHSGGFVVHRHHGHGEPPTEHGAKDADELHDHVEEHFGEPNDGEGDSEGS